MLQVEVTEGFSNAFLVEIEEQLLRIQMLLSALLDIRVMPSVATEIVIGVVPRKNSDVAWLGYLSVRTLVVLCKSYLHVLKVAIGVCLTKVAKHQLDLPVPLMVAVLTAMRVDHHHRNEH